MKSRLRPEPGGAADAAGGAVFWGADDDLGVVGEDVGGHEGGKRCVEVGQGRKAAAEHDDLGVNKVHNGSEAAG